MSEKDRRKKDGQNKDKRNQRMRGSVEDRKQQNPTARQKEKHEAKDDGYGAGRGGADAKEARITGALGDGAGTTAQSFPFVI